MPDHPQAPEIKPIHEAPKTPEIKPPPKEAVVEITEQEKPARPEKTEEGFLEDAIETLKKKLKGGKKKIMLVPTVKDKVTVEIEHIMEAGLDDAFRELTPLQQQEFKIKGEETAWEIRQLLKTAHLKIKRIFKLILDWLKMLPGINRFFLEQEAKIKTDKIMALKELNKNK